MLKNLRACDIHPVLYVGSLEAIGGGAIAPAADQITSMQSLPKQACM